MDFNLQKEPKTISEVFSQVSTEQSIDLEMNLPDYCSDIKSILKCILTPNINSVQESGQRVSASGNVVVRLIYVNDDDKIDCYEQTVELSKFVEVKELPNNPILTANATVQYVNCRAASQRRASINANISIKFTVIHAQKHDFPSDALGCCVETKKEKTEVEILISQNEKTFDLSETLVLPSDKPPVGKILRTQGWTVIESKKTVTNKILIKGEAFFEILYCCDSDEMKFEKLIHSMPVSQIIEVVGIDDNTDCDVNLDVRSLSLQTKTDSSGESKLIEIACKISAFIKAVKNEEITFITDCYSTKYEIDSQYALQNFDKLIHIDDFQRTIKTTVDLTSSEIKQVLDVWCNKISTNITTEKDNANGIANLALSIIYIDENDKIQYNEKNIDYEFAFKLNDEYDNINANSKLQVEKIDFSKMGKDKIELKIQAHIFVNIHSSVNQKVCTNITVNEENLKDSDSVALTVYFGTKGEKVWEIAKKYNTTLQAISEENSLSGEEISEDCMLIIPCA